MSTLVLQLSEAVSDNSLKKISDIEVNFSGNWSSAQRANRISVNPGDSSCTARIVEGTAHFTDSSNSSDYGKTLSLTPNQSNTIYISSGTAKIYIDCKYTCTLFTAWIDNYARTVSISEDILYMPNCSFLTLYYVSIDGIFDIENLSSLRELTCYRFSALNQSSITANQINNIDPLISVTCDNVSRNINVTGHLTDINKINISRLTLGGDIDGSVEDFLDGLYANSKVSGTVELHLSGTNCTYNGEACPNELIASFTSNGWTIS